MVYTERAETDGSSFMWHQPCQRCKYTTSVDIEKTRYKRPVSHVESHASAVSLLESRDYCYNYIKAINNVVYGNLPPGKVSESDAGSVQ